jgi:hypothetical protein
MGYVFAMEHSFNHLNQSLVEPFYTPLDFELYGAMYYC